MADLSLCSEEELKDIIDRARERMRELECIKRSEIRARVAALIHTEGLQVEHVFPELAPLTVHAVKYRHPNYHFLTWSGQGSAPRWFLDMLSLGWSKDRLLVANQRPSEPTKLARQRIRSRTADTSGLFAGVAKLSRQLRRQVR